VDLRAGRNEDRRLDAIVMSLSRCIFSIVELQVGIRIYTGIKVWHLSFENEIFLTKKFKNLVFEGFQTR